MCAFLVKLRVMDTKCGYVGSYEERLAQQKSGAALSKSSTYFLGCYCIQGVQSLEPMEGFKHEVQL